MLDCRLINSLFAPGDPLMTQLRQVQHLVSADRVLPTQPGNRVLWDSRSPCWSLWCSQTAKRSCYQQTAAVWTPSNSDILSVVLCRTNCIDGFRAALSWNKADRRFLDDSRSTIMN